MRALQPLEHIRLQPRTHTVAASNTYGCSLPHPRLQATRAAASSTGTCPLARTRGPAPGSLTLTLALALALALTLTLTLTLILTLNLTLTLALALTHPSLGPALAPRPPAGAPFREVFDAHGRPVPQHTPGVSADAAPAPGPAPGPVPAPAGPPGVPVRYGPYAGPPQARPTPYGRAS